MQGRRQRPQKKPCNAREDLSRPVGGKPVGATRWARDPRLDACPPPIVALDYIPDIDIFIPGDVFAIIIAFLAKTRRCAQFGAGGVVQCNDDVLFARPSYHRHVGAYRLVCRRWARLAAAHVWKLTAPLWLALGPAPVAAAFPHVRQLTVPVWINENYIETISQLVGMYRHDQRQFLIRTHMNINDKANAVCIAHDAYVTYLAPGEDEFWFYQRKEHFEASANGRWQHVAIQWRRHQLWVFVDPSIARSTLIHILRCRVSVYIHALDSSFLPYIYIGCFQAEEILVVPDDVQTITVLAEFMHPMYWRDARLPKLGFFASRAWSAEIEDAVKRHFPYATIDNALPQYGSTDDSD